MRVVVHFKFVLSVNLVCIFSKVIVVSDGESYDTFNENKWVIVTSNSFFLILAFHC